MKPINLSEKEMMIDGFHSQKEIASNYDSSAGECSSNQLRDTFLTLLAEEHDLGAQILDEMKARGWVKDKEAQQSDIAKTKEKFLN